MSCPGYGMKSHVMWNFQDSFGTSQTTSLSAIPVTNVSLNKTIAELADNNMYARFSETDVFQGASEISGSIEAEIDSISLGWFLKSVVGLTSTTSGAGTQTHLFNPRTSDFDCYAAGNPATVEVSYNVGSAAVYYDLVGNSLTFNVSNGELLNLSCDFVGAGYSLKAAGSPSYPVSKAFNWSQSSVSIGGNAVSDIKDLSISFNNNIESDYVLSNTISPERIKRSGMQQIEVSGTVLFATFSYQDAFDNFSELPFIANFAQSNGLDSVKFDIPSLKFTNFDKSISGGGLIQGTFTSKGLYNSGSGTSMAITLVNTQTYY